MPHIKLLKSLSFISQGVKNIPWGALEKEPTYLKSWSIHLEFFIAEKKLTENVNRDVKSLV
jgi:hypothetical protein